MNCPKCGANNIIGSSFCIKCGSNLNENITNSNYMNNENINNLNSNMNMQNNNQVYQEMNQTVENNNLNGSINNDMNNNIQYNPYSQNIQQSVNVKSDNVSNEALSFIPYIIAVILKPFRTFNEENSKLNNTKNSIILGVIISIFMTLISTIRSMISAVKVTTGGIFTEAKTTWEWSNLKEINYFKVIGQNLLLYLGIIVCVALIFYLASLIVKKQTSYVKMIAITATSFIPFAIGSMILSPLLSNISTQVGSVLTIISCIYTLVLFNEFMNDEIKLEGDKRVYFNLICYSLILIICYFVLIKYVGSLFSGFGIGSSTSGTSSILDMFE